MLVFEIDSTSKSGYLHGEPMADQSQDFRGDPSAFRTTHWSLVLAAVNVDSPKAREALEQLCQDYWYPIYAFIRRKGYDVEKARDLTQELFARLIGKDYLKTADREKGRFRTFLLAC